MRDEFPADMVEALIDTAERANVGSPELFAKLREKPTGQLIAELAWLIENGGGLFYGADSTY